MMSRPQGESGEESTLPGNPRNVHGLDSASHLLIERSKRALFFQSGINFNQKSVLEGACAVTLSQLIFPFEQGF